MAGIAAVFDVLESRNLQHVTGRSVRHNFVHSSADDHGFLELQFRRTGAYDESHREETG